MKYIAFAIIAFIVVYSLSSKNGEGVENPSLIGGTDTVVLYGTSWCGYCAKARSFLKNNKVHYVEYDIEEDSAARQAYQKLNGRGIPMIVTNDKIIRGYNESALKQIAADSRYRL